MATLTVADINHIRHQTGDTCEPYDVSDEYMQWLHDNRAANAPLCAFAGEPLGSTIVWVLRTRSAKAQRLYNETGEGNAGSVKQKRDHIKEDLADWESKCGLSGATITISYLDTQLDRDDPETEYARLRDEAEWGYFG